MAGNSNFPTTLDDNASLYEVTDNVTGIQAAHHNNLKEAIKAIEAKLGTDNTTVPTSIDARLGHPTLGHTHDGATGNGPLVSLAGIGEATVAGTAVLLASAVFGDLSAEAHAANAEIHDTNGLAGYRNAFTFRQGSIASGAGQGAIPIAPGIGIPQELMQIEAVLRRAPSGATTVIDVNFGATSIWVASQGNRIMFAPGATYAVRTSFGNPTLSGAGIVSIDADAVGSSDPGQDLSLKFIFRANG